jgi:hypothetical protein
MRAESCGAVELWIVSLVLHACEEAFQGDVVTLFSGPHLSLMNALGERRTVVA